MNTNKNIEKACAHGEELVSYLYGEMPTTKRTVFEYHLADCSVCTDEFAEISLARLGVYEWHRDEFASMQTPLIPIPYENIERVSRFMSWFGPIFSAPKWLTASGALTVAVVVIGLFLFISNDIGNNVSIADINSVITPDTVQDKSTIPSIGKDKQIVEVKTPNLLNNNKDKRVRASVAPAFGKGRKMNDRVIAAKTPLNIKKPESSLMSAPPRLTNFEDEGDNTLRLADLIADIDTDEK